MFAPGFESFIWLLVALFYNAIECRSEEYLLLAVFKATSRKQINMNRLKISIVEWEKTGSPILRHWCYYIPMWSQVFLLSFLFISDIRNLFLLA